jgi:4-carboxymuconolactone decarboxylase
MKRSRVRRLEFEALASEQRSVLERIASGPRGAVPLIFHALLGSPELAERVQHLGALLRYSSGLQPRESELAILTTAQFWRCTYEWEHHEVAARAAGLQESAIAAIQRDDRSALAPCDALLHRFVRTALENSDVPDDVFDAVVERYGHTTTVSLAALVGYYSMLALITRAVRLDSEQQG